MFRSNLLKLSVTLVSLVATAFVSVTAVAAAGSYTIIQVKAASGCAALGGTAADLSDYFLRHPDTCIPANTTTEASIPSSLDNPNGHWIGPETVNAALGQPTVLSTLDNPNGHWIGPETVNAALGQPAALSTLDNPNGHWIGPETVSAALGQQSYSVTYGSSEWAAALRVGAALGQQSYSVTYGSSEWAAALRVSVAQGQQSYSVPTTGGSGDLIPGSATWRDAGASGRGPYASPQAALVSMRRQNSDAPGR